MNGESYESRFPALFAEQDWRWGPITAQFRMASEPPTPESLIKVRVVPFVGDQVVTLKMADGNWDHPGGTLEPGESFLDALARESMEEAGALITNFSIFGVFDCVSHQPEPYRPHYPHPKFTQVIGFGDAELIGEPAPPTPGEYEVIRLVDIVDLDVAVNRLRARSDGEWQADMYRLAAERRNEH
jgi:8-oxo-dGTP pyrophosphatase MutT (NUDIX family)